MQVTFCQVAGIAFCFRPPQALKVNMRLGALEYILPVFSKSSNFPSLRFIPNATSCRCAQQGTYSLVT